MGAVYPKHRKPDMYDEDLVLRAAGAAAITTTGGDAASPDYLSSAIDFGPAAKYGRVLIENLALTLPSENDGLARFQVIGCDSAGTATEVLAELPIGCAEMTGNAADDADDDKDLDIFFCTAKREVTYPKIKLAIVTEGTSISVDCTARVVPVGIPWAQA